LLSVWTFCKDESLIQQLKSKLIEFCRVKLLIIISSLLLHIEIFKKYTAIPVGQPRLNVVYCYLFSVTIASQYFVVSAFSSLSKRRRTHQWITLDQLSCYCCCMGKCYLVGFTAVVDGDKQAVSSRWW
jgi:hypothetical protein